MILGSFVFSSNNRTAVNALLRNINNTFLYKSSIVTKSGLLEVTCNFSLLGGLNNVGGAHGHYCSLPLDGVGRFDCTNAETRRFAGTRDGAANIQLRVTLLGQLARLLGTRS